MSERKVEVEGFEVPADESSDPTAAFGAPSPEGYWRVICQILVGINKMNTNIGHLRASADAAYVRGEELLRARDDLLASEQRMVGLTERLEQAADRVVGAVGRGPGQPEGGE